jgi:hypothetical protein
MEVVIARFSWKDRGKPKEPSVRMAGLTTDI